MLKNFLIQASHYSLSGLLTTCASMLSFPVLTRVLDVHEYGLLSLISATIAFVVAFGKCGLQFSVVRFYADVKAGKSQWDLATFYSTVILSMSGLGLIVTLVWLAILCFAPGQLWTDDHLRFLLIFTAISVFFHVVTSAFENILIAQQKSGVLSIFTVAIRYGELIAVIFALLVIASNLVSFYTATILVQAIGMFVLARIVMRHITLEPAAYSADLVKQMVLYGFPLLGTEFSHILLALGDRYIIQWMLGSGALGTYAASYNMCSFIQAIFIVSLFRAIRPMYLRIWAEEGEQATKDFIQRTLRLYLMLALPVIAGVSIVGSELLMLLASEKYKSGAVIIPYVISGMMVYGSVSMLGAGLHIKKQGLVIMTLVLIAGACNIILNIALIPLFGIEGAAIATLFSYVLLAALNVSVVSRFLAIRMPWLCAAKFGLAALVMYLVVTHISASGQIATIAMHVIVGALIYGLLVILIDRESREMVYRLPTVFRS